MARVAAAGERSHFHDERVLGGPQTQWDQRVNHGEGRRRRDRAIRRRRRRGERTGNPPLVLRRLSSYSWHGWRPQERVEILGGIHTLVPRHHPNFN